MEIEHFQLCALVEPFDANLWYLWVNKLCHSGNYLILSEKINYYKSIIAMVKIITYCNSPLC